MATSKRSRLLLLGLAVLAGISFWRAVSVEHEKRTIAQSYEKAKQTLAELENERAELSTELASTKTTLSTKEQDLGTMQQELTDVQSKLDSTVTELASLQRDHERLRDANASLTTQLSSVTEEKQELETKLNDIKQLRLAIRDVRRRMGEERWAAWRNHVESQRQADAERLASGNRGFLTQDGSPTFRSSGRKLQVQVLDPQLQ